MNERFSPGGRVYPTGNENYSMKPHNSTQTKGRPARQNRAHSLKEQAAKSAPTLRRIHYLLLSIPDGRYRNDKASYDRLIKLVMGS